MGRKRTNGRHQPSAAAALAVLGHLLALLALGWRIPKAPPQMAEDALPQVEVQLLRAPFHRSPQAKSAPTKPAPSPPSASARVLIAPTPSAPPLGAPGQATPAPSVAQGPADCAIEDLPLLTDAEKARCRNQIDADRERRLARGSNQRAARQVAEAQRMGPAYRMTPEKEAYYAAVSRAYWEMSSDGPKLAGHLPGFGCSAPGGGGLPLLGGVEINRNIFAKKREPRPANSLKLGPLPCYLVPPRGPFTPEADLDPLDDKWRGKP